MVMTMKMKKFAQAILTLLILLASTTPTYAIPPNLTAEELVSRMYAGWNLGNTFDAWDGPGRRLTGDIYMIETLWLGGQGQRTTQTLIQAIRRAGFDTLRIPVTWSKVADPENDWQLREDWLARVQQVVDWALYEDMFVILNTHHENTALNLGEPNANNPEHSGYHFLTSIWYQIATHFRDYDERLIFASMNEPRHEGGENEWWGATGTVRDNVNYLNQAFVDVVRATGGNNLYRILQIPTVAAGATPNGMRDFIVPQDPHNTVNKLVWSIHTYSPFNWAHDGFGTYDDPTQILNDLENVFNNAQRLGLPVILGEWGSIRVSRGENADQDLRNYQRPIHAEDYTRIALERGMPAVIWDNGGFTGIDHTFGIIPRMYPHAMSRYHQELINGIMRGAGRYQYVVLVEIPPEPEEEPEPDPTPEPEPEYIPTGEPELTPEEERLAEVMALLEAAEDGHNWAGRITIAVISGAILLFFILKMMENKVR